MFLVSRYRQILAYPGVTRVMAASFTCRLLSGMISLSLLLVVKKATGSYGTAGFVVGAYALALAFTSPFWGRVADRHGSRTALAWAVSLQSLSFAAFVLTAAASAWPVLLTLTAFLAGAATPPAAAVSNAVFMAVVADAEDRRTLFALSGLLTEAVFVVGPLTVAAIVLFLPALVTIAFIAAVSAAGAWWLRGAPAVKKIDLLRPKLSGAAPRLDPDRAQIHLLLIVMASAFTFGGLQVSLVAQSGRLGVSAGVFLAAVASGGIAGSFLYGGIRLPGGPLTQLGVLLSLYGGFIVALGIQPALLLTLALAVLIGFVTGPLDAAETLLVGEYTPERSRAQAFAAINAANWLGFAAGTSVTGAVVQRLSPGYGAVVAGAVALATAASLAAAPRHTTLPAPGKAAAQHPSTPPEPTSEACQ
jgi:MFS family permease